MEKGAKQLIFLSSINYKITYIYIYTPYTLWQYLTKYKAIQDFESNGMDLERNLHVVLWATIVGWCV